MSDMLSSHFNSNRPDPEIEGYQLGEPYSDAADTHGDAKTVKVELSGGISKASPHANAKLTTVQENPTHEKDSYTPVAQFKPGVAVSASQSNANNQQDFNDLADLESQLRIQQLRKQ